MAGIERGTPSGDSTPQQRTPTEQHKPQQEGGNGSPGHPPTLHERAKAPPESRARQPLQLPNVWDYAERKVRLHAPDVEDRPQRESEEYKREMEEVNRLYRELEERGTPRDNLILDLYGEIRCEPAPFPNPTRLRDLSLEEFQQFRSRVESLSDEQITEEILKAEAEFDRKSDEFGGGFAPPGSTVRV